jgi:hypothetical protein
MLLVGLLVNKKGKRTMKDFGDIGIGILICAIVIGSIFMSTMFGTVLVKSDCVDYGYLHINGKVYKCVEGK